MRYGFVIVILLILAGCSSESHDKKNGRAEEEEVFPDVDLKNFDTVRISGEFQFIVPDFVSEVAVSSDLGVIEFNHLSKECHIYLERSPKNEYVKSLKARKMSSGNSLMDYAEECQSGFMGRIKSPESSELLESKVNGLNCYRFEVRGSTYGFPLPKVFFIRCFEGKDNFYTLVGWTVEKNRSQLEKAFLATGLSFRELN